MQEKATEIVNTPSIDILYFFNQIFDYFSSNLPDFTSSTLIILKNIFGVIIGLSFPISLIFLIGIVLSVERLKDIRKKEGEIYDAKVDMGYGKVFKVSEDNHLRWQKVIQQVEASNENDWRHAILEADIMLGELLSKMGYKGDSIGEQLKRVSRGDFKNLDNAWEAHKIRNSIAHEGSLFSLNQIEARRIINLYKQVFLEFYYI